jgi:hypothetical protein
MFCVCLQRLPMFTVIGFLRMPCVPYSMDNVSITPSTSVLDETVGTLPERSVSPVLEPSASAYRRDSSALKALPVVEQSLQSTKQFLYELSESKLGDMGPVSPAGASSSRPASGRLSARSQAPKLETVLEKPAVATHVASTPAQQSHRSNGDEYADDPFLVESPAADSRSPDRKSVRLPPSPDVKSPLVKSPLQNPAVAVPGGVRGTVTADDGDDYDDDGWIPAEDDANDVGSPHKL